MLKSIKHHWKNILIIFMIYVIWSFATLLLIISYQSWEKTLQQFGGSNMFYINQIQSVLKGTLVYYILIYHLVIPIIKKQNRKKKLLQTCIFFFLLTIAEYIWNFKIGKVTLAEAGDLTLWGFMWTTILLDFLIILVAIFVATLITSEEIKKRKEELEKEKLIAELSAIKYQINPHFLFNSLSLIYTKTIKTSPEAAHAVHLLSEIMSYALDDWGELGTVPLALEIEQMKKVIEMNQLRFSHQLKINYREEIEVNDAYIPTLTFITLVENAFKHGELNDDKNQVTIELIATKSKISFLVSNKKKKGPKEPSKGIGLSNVQQRLQLMYGIKHSFIVKEDENYYLNEIIINL